jgi:hypothetical protein
MMGGHLGDEVMLSVLEGSAGAEESGHAAACAHCRARLEQAQAGLELALGAEVPDPGPFYWQSFRRQVGTRIQEGDALPRWKRLAVSPWLAAAAAVVVAVALLVPARGPAPGGPAAGGPAAPLPAWSALPPADEDPGLELLAAVMPVGAEEAVLAGCQGLGQCLGEAVALSEEDGQALEDALRLDLGASL